jgi:hypothetical protein
MVVLVLAVGVGAAGCGEKSASTPYRPTTTPTTTKTGYPNKPTHY